MNTATSDATADQADMARLVEGHDAALEVLMGRHGEPLLHYLIRLLQNESEAADLAEETFVRVYLNRKKFNSRHKFSSWLFAIATNLARDRIRWLARHQQVSIESRGDDEGSLKNVLPARGPNPTEAMESKERAAAVSRAVGRLPEELRVPLVLAEYEERSHAEIAAILNCSAKAVEMRIYRARQQLRADLAVFISPSAQS